MATITQTETATQPEYLEIGATPNYPDEKWSTTCVNYYKDADAPPPDTLNSTLSEHEIRLSRRSDDSPHVARTLVRIKNIRGEEDHYNIAEHGFKISTLQSEMKHIDWSSIDARKSVYFPEVTELLKRELGAKEVFQYEHHVRTDSLENALQQDTKGEVDINGPVRRVHIDETPKSARREFEYWVLEQMGRPELRGRQFGIFNVWKPLKTIHKDPLCLCDVQTLRQEDLKVGKVTVPGVGEIENFSIRPPVEGEHGFVYLRDQAPDEALVFRIFDSRVDEGGCDGISPASWDGMGSHGVAHTSFVDPGTEGCVPRQSVEVRNFCVF